jgi:hypothetical protein
MIAEYLAPSIDRVLTIALVAGVISFVIAKLARVSLNWVVILILLIGAAVATLYSLNYSYEFLGGDWIWQRRGYPHYFYGSGTSRNLAAPADSQSMQGFELGPAGIYFWGNILFYASLAALAYVSFGGVIRKLRIQK